MAFQDFQNMKLIRTPDLAKIMECSPQTLMRMAHRGEFPKPVKISSRYVRWRVSDIEDFINERTKSGTSISKNH